MQTHAVDLLQSSAMVWPLCGFGYNFKAVKSNGAYIESISLFFLVENTSYALV